MKFFKYFSYSELKLVCELLEKKHCYFRNTQKRFNEDLGEYLVDLLLKGGCIKESPITGQSWDYKEDCYEFTKSFRRVYNFMTTPFWLWVKIYVLNFYWFEHKWQQLCIACGHHYDWQDYEGCDINDI